MRLGMTIVLASCTSAIAQTWPPSFSFDPPQYLGSALGVPLAGQTGWMTPPGAPSGAWLVYTHDGSPFSLPSAGSSQFVAATEPAKVEIKTSISEEFLIVMAVQLPKGVTTPGTLGTISVQPSGKSDCFSIHAVASSTPGRWHIEVTYADKGGTQHRSAITAAGFNDLLPEKWYVLNYLVGYQNAVRDIWITDPATGQRTTFKPSGWYLPGGAGTWTGGVILQLTAEDSPSLGSVIALDLLTESWHCARSETDCDRDYALTVFDFLCYQNAFVAELEYADCEPDGVLDMFDFFCFMFTFISGCP